MCKVYCRLTLSWKERRVCTSWAMPAYCWNEHYKNDHVSWSHLLAGPLFSQKKKKKKKRNIWRNKQHRTLGFTRSFCDLFVWGERKKTSSRSSSGKFSHRARPETNYWHPCQCFNTIKKAHSRIPTVNSRRFCAPALRACILHVRFGYEMAKIQLWAARSEDNGEISIVRRQKEEVGVQRSSDVQTVLLWNKPS